MIKSKRLLIVIKMECSKCIHFKPLLNAEYTCKYIESGDVGFEGDSVQTAEMCEHYKEK